MTQAEGRRNLGADGPSGGSGGESAQSPANGAISMIDGELTHRVSPENYSSIADEWTVQEDGSFVSPDRNYDKQQILLFEHVINNGSISANITVMKSDQNDNKTPEASIDFRYQDPKKYYYGGLGLYGAKFGLAKAISIWPDYMRLSIAGVGKSIVVAGRSYRIRVEFRGSRMVLLENDIQHAIALDEDYRIGQWGITAYNCQAMFANVTYSRAEPIAFIVMPFASELDYVHGTLARCLRKFGIRPTRGDDMFFARPIVDDLKEQIANADLILVDFTGRNPNVYYEAGLADAWKKNWIILAQSADDLSFDVRHIRTIYYSNVMGADVKLASDLDRALEALGYRALPTPPPGC